MAQILLHHRETIEGVTVFADALAIIAADDDETRIISARRATKQERRRHEEGEAT